MIHVERYTAHVAASKLNNGDLDAECEDNDEEEHPVVAEAGKDIEVTLTELARVDLIEELHENEGLEGDSVHQHLVARFKFDDWAWLEIGILFALPWSSAWAAGSSDVMFVIVEVVFLVEIDIENFCAAEEEDEKDNDLED